MNALPAFQTPFRWTERNKSWTKEKAESIIKQRILKYISEMCGREVQFYFTFVWCVHPHSSLPVIKLFSGTNYNYALLKIIKNSRRALQMWKNLLPACFSHLHHWFWSSEKSSEAPQKDAVSSSEWGGGGGRRMPFSSIVRTSDFIYTCLSTREMAECVFMYFLKSFKARRRSGTEGEKHRVNVSLFPETWKCER